MYAEFESECEFCEWTAIWEDALSAGQKIGDYAHKDPQNPARGRCNRCKRHKMKITKVPETTRVEGHTGFWKVPKE